MRDENKIGETKKNLSCIKPQLYRQLDTENER